jgi:hypothetical protein
VPSPVIDPQLVTAEEPSSPTQVAEDSQATFYPIEGIEGITTQEADD